MVIKALSLNKTTDLLQPTFETYVYVFQKLIIYFSTSLLVLLVLSLILSMFNTKNSIFIKFFNFIKYSNILNISILFLVVFIKFNFYLWNFNDYTQNVSTQYIFDILLLNQFNFSDITINGSILSDVICLLALSSGIVCIYLLGDKNLVKYTSNLNLFSIFFLAILTMVYTSNLLVMFVCFEFLFLPTLYFVNTHGYVQRVDKTLKILLYWTLFGAFLVLTSLSYLYYKYKTLNYYRLISIDFSELESWFLCLTIFVGFGIKIPVTPFHYWLTKIHVEAPAGFSIFLSGFLVKAALYCFYFFNLIFVNDEITVFICIVAFLGIAESSIKMWTQTDFKKLIAYATIQEMNLILFLMIGAQNCIDYGLILFILIHGWLSTLMFFLVDIIQKKSGTRNIVELSGFATKYPNIKLLIWFVLLLFSGFPLTIKFVIEWEVLCSLLVCSPNLQILIFFIVAFFGVVGFAKQMMIILYGMPRHNTVNNSVISKRDQYLFYLIVFILVYLNLLNFFLA